MYNVSGNFDTKMRKTMKRNFIPALIIFLCASFSINQANAQSYMYDNDDPFDGIENAVDIQGDLIEGAFDDTFEKQHHWYTDSVADPGWYEIKITEGSRGNYIEFYDGEEHLLSLTNCGVGGGARFEITNRLYISIYGSGGSYKLEVNRFELNQDILNEREIFGFTGDDPYIELFGVFSEGGGDYFCIGRRFGAYLVSDFRVANPDCFPGLDIFIGDSSDADTGVRMLNLECEARFKANRTPDKYFLYAIYGNGCGEYIVRCQGSPY